MSEHEETGIDRKTVEPGVLLLRYIQFFSWLVLLVFVAGGWYLFGWPFARSVLVGGVLANGSFFLLKKDIEQLIHRVAMAGGDMKAVKRIEKIRFFLKFYARLILLGLLLFVLATKLSINMIGLVLGLSTIMLSVIIVVLSKGRMIYSVQRVKGA
ncbi:ATP synthase subunit I [Desulfolithobacter sp.]